MSTRKKFLLAVCLFSLLATLQPNIPLLRAQDEIDCFPAVQEALTKVGDSCNNTGRNEACYGNAVVDVDPRPGVDIAFFSTGDLTALANISQLHTGPFNADTGEWGICVMRVQANLPDALPGQNITFLLLGDVTLTDVSGENKPPMHAFRFRSEVGAPRCQAAPNSLVIQNPGDTQITLDINGVEVTLGSTSILSANESTGMDVLIVEGEGQISALGESQIVPDGQFTSVALGGATGLAPTSPPTPPEDFPPERVQGTPFFLLPEPVSRAALEMSQCDLYLGSLEPGTVVFLQAGVPHQTWPTAAEAQAYMDATTISITVDGVPLPVYHQQGGVHQFTLIGDDGYGFGGAADWVATPGTHTINMDWSQCDLSAWGTCSPTCTVTVPGANDQPAASAPAAGPACTITASSNVNLRSGPGTSFAVAGTLAAGESDRVDRQATGADELVWWRLARGPWVRSDVVSEAGNCDIVPVASSS